MRVRRADHQSFSHSLTRSPWHTSSHSTHWNLNPYLSNPKHEPRTRETSRCSVHGRRAADQSHSFSHSLTLSLSPPLTLSLSERESSLWTTYWAESTTSSKCLTGPALRPGSLNFLFHIAEHLPSSLSLAPQDCHRGHRARWPARLPPGLKRKSSLLTTYWFDSTQPSR